MIKMEKERKLQIIRMAAKRFARHGANKTTLDEIARDMRIGKATIYHYFTSKEELFYATLDWEGQQFLDDIKNILSKDDLKIKDRLIEFFVYKETLNQKYKLLYDALLIILKEEYFEREAEIIKGIITKEEEIVGSFLSKYFIERKGAAFVSIISFVVNQSWGLLFTGKINQSFQPGIQAASRESLSIFLDNFQEKQ